ncbi:hypothetical protein DPX16_5091 [Anabarilius grahami]|uniref:Uncharacterized protein n=1 Tax=Anabarilius grahami TaxID=495550 RepID=A0A3N0XKX3_ANAGA|nr:hypothetical protein DPX16_5091 [Anabarilius grahami]
MPTSPVKTRIPLTSFGHLISEVKFVLATYGILALTAAAYMLRRSSRKEGHETASASS